MIDAYFAGQNVVVPEIDSELGIQPFECQDCFLAMFETEWPDVGGAVNSICIVEPECLNLVLIHVRVRYQAVVHQV